MPPNVDRRVLRSKAHRVRDSYVTWGVVDSRAVFTMFRRAKLGLNAVPAGAMGAGGESFLLIGRAGSVRRRRRDVACFRQASSNPVDGHRD